jgi:hypothetical protein
MIRSKLLRSLIVCAGGTPTHPAMGKLLVNSPISGEDLTRKLSRSCNDLGPGDLARKSS